jgi:MraZ protein
MGHNFPNNETFRGRYHYSIDSKGRLSIPSQFREILRLKYKEESAMLTSLGNSLVAYPLSEWLIIEEKVSKLPQIKPEVRKFQLLFISGAVKCSLDKQGRILIPSALREYATLKKEVVIAGMLNRFEIWDKRRWEEEMTVLSENFEEISKVLSDLGL